MVNSNAVSGSTAAGRVFLSRNAIKYILVVLMLLDHTCFVFQAQLPAAVYAVVHTLSRVVAPTMAFFVAEGFLHTSDRTKYRRRMGIFALISWLPCVALFISREELAATPFIVIFHSILSSFYLALVALSVWESEKFKKGMKIFLVVLICLASCLTDMPVVGVLAPFFQYVYRDNRKKRYITVGLSYIVMLLSIPRQGWMQLGMLLTIPFIMLCYNGKGGSRSGFNKWFFYIFFPVHMLILALIKWFLI
jgi:hypothetical protein